MEYPDGNPGEWPVDLSSDVGRFRALVGDLNAAEYNPPKPGFRSFEMFSDDEIEAYIVQGGSVTRGIGYAYLYLASQAAKESVSIGDYDLKIDKTKRAADLTAIAKLWFGQADGEEIIAGEEAFEIVHTGTSSGQFIPELSIPIYGRKYTMGRWR